MTVNDAAGSSSAYHWLATLIGVDVLTDAQPDNLAACGANGNEDRTYRLVLS
ncbi:hypothetical protein WI664_10345 [Vibrio cholerae]